MKDWEDAILDMQESEEDECSTCEYRGERCRNQCSRIDVRYNPFLPRLINKAKGN